MTEPGLGSGALREALEAATLRYSRNHGEPDPSPAFAYEAVFTMEQWERLCNAALSLSSPIEPAYTLDDKLRALHEDNVNISQMLVMLAKDVHGLGRPTSQASSEIRAKMMASFDKVIPSFETRVQIVSCILRALAPSRQGAGGK